MSNILITAPFCASCEVTKREYAKYGISFREVLYDSKEGEELVDKYSIRRVPVLIHKDKLYYGIPEKSDIETLCD